MWEHSWLAHPQQKPRVGKSRGALVLRVVAIPWAQHATKEHDVAQRTVLTSLVLSSDFHFHPVTSFLPLRALRACVPSADFIIPASLNGNSPGPGKSRTKVGSYRRLSGLGTAPSILLWGATSKLVEKGCLLPRPLAYASCVDLAGKSLLWFHFSSLAEEREVTESNATEEQCIPGKDRLDGAVGQVKKDVY